MVRGLDRFQAHFAEQKDKFVLIGGTALSVAMNDIGMDFRATKDLDIVLCVEALDTDFAKRFWEFVNAGGYDNRQKSTGKKLFYRFYAPKDATFPHMLELFSKIPDALHIAGAAHLTPIPFDDEVSSLSAILLETAYYDFIHAGREEIGGLPIVLPEYIIPLKARAWLDLNRRRQEGEQVAAKDVRKHKNDVIRAFRVVAPTARVPLPESIARNLKEFLSSPAEDPVDLKALGIADMDMEQVISQVEEIYKI